MYNMKNLLTFGLSMIFTICTIRIPGVSASGFVSLPPSRQARCAQPDAINLIPSCGAVRWEPQSVVAPTGSLMCNGNSTRFTELNDPFLWADRYFTVPAGAQGMDLTWSIEASRKTRSFQYFFLPYPTGDTDIAPPVLPGSQDGDSTSGWNALTPPYVLLASFNEDNRTVPSLVTHHVPFKGRTGRKTVLALWNVVSCDSDGENEVEETYYSCVDLVITGGEVPVVNGSGNGTDGYYYS